MQTQHYIKILKHDWWIIVAAVLITTGIGIAYSYSQPPVYEAQATFVVNPSARIIDTYDQLYSIDTLAGRSSLATTYANILQSQSVIEAAAQSLGVPSEMMKDYKVNSVVLPESTVLLLQVHGPSAALGVDLANAIGVYGLEYITGLQEIYELRQLDPAVLLLDVEPVSPNHVNNIVLSIIIGLVAGVGFVILRQFLLQHSSDTNNFSTTPATESQ